jgi:bifunctional DNA-binding transcriptional regulator/antitoxin component of YhaV-PrlF toxin-antitoxin module
MITTVTGKNMVTIPAELGRQMEIGPGARLSWRQGHGADELVVRVIPARATLARRLRGAGRRHAPKRDAIAELIDERRAEV